MPETHPTTVIDAPDGSFDVYCLTCGSVAQTAHLGPALVWRSVHSSKAQDDASAARLVADA